MRYLYILIVAIVSCNSLSAQEITNLLIIPEETDNLSFKALFLTEDIYVDNGRPYINLIGPGVRDLDLGLDFSTIPAGQVQISPNTGQDSPIGYNFYMEYSENEFFDFTAIMNLSFQEPIGIDGERIAYAFAGARGWFDDLKVFGDSTTWVWDEDIRNDIAVYDKLNDTLLWHYPDHEDYSHKLLSQGIDIDGDYLYYAMTFNHPHPFMGDSLVRTNTTSLGNNYSSALHKINWRTNEKLWSINMASEVLPDEIRDIKVLEDGSVMMAIESYGPFTWDGEVLDPEYMYGSPFGGYYNIVLARISSDGEYLNHVHLWAPGNFSALDIQIEPSGNVYTYGLIRNGEGTPNEGFVEVHGDSIRFDSGTFGTGNLMAFDKNLNLRWTKEYGGASTVHVTSVNELINKEIVVNIRIFENVFIKGEFYENEYFDNEYFGEPNPLKQNYILHYNEEGDLISEPLPFGDSFETREILEIAENTYLFMLRNNIPEFATPIYFEEEIGIYHDEYVTLMEVEGGFFESITSVNEYVQAQEILSFPNPVIDAPTITLTMPDNCIGQNCTLSVFDKAGKLKFDDKYSTVREEIQLSTNNLSQGINTILIRSNGSIYKSRVVKIN